MGGGVKELGNRHGRGVPRDTVTHVQGCPLRVVLASLKVHRTKKKKKREKRVVRDVSQPPPVNGCLHSP